MTSALFRDTVDVESMTCLNIYRERQSFKPFDDEQTKGNPPTIFLTVRTIIYKITCDRDVSYGFRVRNWQTENGTREEIDDKL